MILSLVLLVGGSRPGGGPNGSLTLVSNLNKELSFAEQRARCGATACEPNQSTWDQAGNVQGQHINQAEIAAVEMDAVGTDALGTILRKIASTV